MGLLFGEKLILNSGETPVCWDCEGRYRLARERQGLSPIPRNRAKILALLFDVDGKFIYKEFSGGLWVKNSAFGERNGLIETGPFRGYWAHGLEKDGFSFLVARANTDPTLGPCAFACTTQIQKDYLRWSDGCDHLKRVLHASRDFLISKN